MSDHIIAAVIVELAYLACGLTLCALGKSLLEKGISGQFQGSGSVASHRFRIVTSSPGLVFSIAGLVVITVAILSPAVYRVTETRGAIEPAAASKETPLSELAGRTIESRFAQNSSEAGVAQLHYELALRSSGKKNHRAAAAHLASTIVLQPSSLNRALGEPNLTDALDDPALVRLIRSRFELPLDLTTDSESAPAIISHLKLYIAARGIPDNATTDPRTTELSRALSKDREREAAPILLELLQTNPRALLRVVEAPQYSWILANERLVGLLRERIESELQPRK